jgi:hypothetical protein
MCLICPDFVVFLKKEIPNYILLSLLQGKINHHHSIFNALYFFFSALRLQECNCCYGDATYFLLFWTGWCRKKIAYLLLFSRDKTHGEKEALFTLEGVLKSEKTSVPYSTV